MKIGIPSYTKEHWTLLKKSAADREKIDRTYAEWEKNRDKTIAILQEKGYKPVLVPMDMVEIEAWCNARQLLNTSENRMLVCNGKLRKIDC